MSMINILLSSYQINTNTMYIIAIALIDIAFDKKTNILSDAASFWSDMLGKNHADCFSPASNSSVVGLN